MIRLKRKTGRHLTEAAREAAAAVREAKKALPKEEREFSLFVVRSSPNRSHYTWQIRRFGGVIVQQAETIFVSISAARADGESALAKIGEALPGSGGYAAVMLA